MVRNNSGDEHEHADDLVAETLESIGSAADSKAGKKAVKAERKAAKREHKQEKKARKKAAKAAAKKTRHAVENGAEPSEVELDDTTSGKDKDTRRMTPQKARNAINVTKVILPAVIPVVTPFAVRAANACRDAYDKYQARRLGIDVGSLSEYSGHGAALHVRIAGLSDGLSELKVGGDAAAQKFAGDAASTMRQLSSAVRAAETMPAERRKEAHRAVAAELDELEAQLLHHLGV